MSRSFYRNETTLSLNYTGHDPVQFDFAHDPKRTTVRGSRIITMPVGSTASTGLHWHEEYTEHVRVIKGRASITLDGMTKDYGAEDGVVIFPKFHIHGFGRADKGKMTAGIEDMEDLVMEEWVDPEDGFKVVFFYNIFGLLLDSRGSVGGTDILRMLMVLDHVDEYPAFIPGPQWLNSAVVRIVMRSATIVGRLCGYQSWYKEYTPEHLWDVAQTRGSKDRSQ